MLLYWKVGTRLNPNTTLIFPEGVISSEESYQIQGKGGIDFGDAMAYKMTLPPDFPYGIVPETIIDNSPTLDNFSKAIAIMASESQVLILISSSSYTSFRYKKVYSQLVNKLEKGSYIIHPEGGKNGYHCPQNEEAGKWVRAHPPQIKKNMASCGGEQKKRKYLIILAILVTVHLRSMVKWVSIRFVSSDHEKCPKYVLGHWFVFV